MQTTLLGLAIAIILALVAALVGPFVIDWGSHRALFEKEASHIVGTNVRVAGAIDARLLPSPRLVLHDVTIGPEGSDQIRVQSIGIEFGLGPLMRGEWHAVEMDVGGPELHVGLDKSGHARVPAIAIKFDPDVFSIDRLSVHDGKIVVSEAASGHDLVLDKLWFNGDVRSLLGPIKGEGAFKVGDDLYPYRVSAGRLREDDSLKLRLNVDPVSYPLSIESDGILSLAKDTPRFDGTLKLARPVAIAQHGAGAVTRPWRLDGKIKITASDALMEQLEFQYGSQEQAIKLDGTADFKFGAQPHFEGVLSSHQIDVDRVLGSGNDSLPPAAAFRKLAELASGAFRPTFPISLGVSIDQVTLGGSSIQNLRGDISTDADGWNLDRFEFRAPGLSRVQLSGQLAVGRTGVAFKGPATIDSGNPRQFASWLTGQAESPKGEARPLHLRGEMTLGSKKIAIERLEAKFDRENISGQLVYTFAAGSQPSRLDASLIAPELDLDAALGFGKALLAGSSIERPHDMSIALDIGHATLGGIDAHKASARLRLDGSGLDVERLAIENLGGATLSASGRIDTSANAPHGHMTVALDASNLAGATTVLAKFAPTAAGKLRDAVPAMAPAKLHADLDVAPAGKGADSKLDVEGMLGAVHVALQADGAVDVNKLDLGDVRISGKLDAKDGRALVALLGLDHVVTADQGAGSLTFKARGPAHGALRVDGKLTAGGLDVAADGTMRVDGEGIKTASLRASVTHANAAPLRRAIGAGSAAVPVSLGGQIALSGSDLNFRNIDATVLGTRVRGNIGVVLGTPPKVTGEIAADRIDAAGLVAAAIGIPHAEVMPAWHWTTDPFVRGAFSNVEGQITLKATRAALTSGLTARELRSTIKLGDHQIMLDDVSGDLAGGRLTGQMSFRNSGDGIAAHLKIAAEGLDMAAVLPASTRPPLVGSLKVNAELDGSGMSPSALIGSLHGTGNVALTGAQIAGLDPHAFDVVAGAVDKGMPVDAAKISGVVDRALESGHFAAASIGGDISAAAGQLRLGDTSAHGNDADVAMTGTLDLTDGTVDARLVLTGAAKSAGDARPDIFVAVRGPMLSPSRTVDVSALTGWLTLRSVERQAKKLEAIQNTPSAPVEASQPSAIVPAAPTIEMAPATQKAAPLPAAPSPPRRNMPAAVAEKRAPEHAPAKKRVAPALPPPLVIRPAPGVAPEFSIISPN